MVPGKRKHRQPRARIPGPRTRSARVWIALAGVLTAAVVLAAALAGAQRHAPRSTPANARLAGRAGVAGAYGYPARCLSITIRADSPAYARADFNRGRRCGRYSGDTTAIFHRADGAWRVVLRTMAYRCPVAGLPPRVQLALAVCDRPVHRRR